MESEPQDSKYQAFISYSRRTDGELIAPALQRGLQGFAKPWYRQRALRVFRDDDSLSANPAIWPTVQKALDASEHFILLASPESAQSEWVGQELEHWLASHEAQKLLLVQTDGAEIAWDAAAGDFAARGNDAVPDALRGVFSDEPRYVDLRWARERDQISLADPRFRDAVADIAAPLRGVPKDEIVGEHVRQHRRARRTAIAGASGLAVLTAVAVAFGILALVSRQQAVDREQETRSVLLANESAAVFDLNPTLALQLARAGYDVAETPASAAAVRQAATVPQPIAELGSSLDRLEDAVFSPDGSSAASVGRDGILRIWDIEAGSGQEPLEFPATPGGLLTKVAYSPDGKLVATASVDGLIRVYDVDAGVDQQPVVLRGHDGSVNSVAFGPNGTTLVSGGRDSTVRVWNLNAPRQPPDVRRAGTGAYFDARISPNGKLIAGASDDATTRVWPAEDPSAAPRVLSRPDDSFAYTVEFAPDSRRLVSGGNGSLRIWDLEDEGAPPIDLIGHFAAVESASFSPDGARLATASRDRTVRVWDVSDPEVRSLLALRGHRGDVKSVDYSPDGERLLSSGVDGRIFVWSADGYAFERVTSWQDNDRTVARVAMVPSGDLVASSGFDGPIYLRELDAAPDAPPIEIGDETFPVRGLALDPSGRRIAAAVGPGTLVWDINGGKLGESFGLRSEGASAEGVAFSPDGSRIAAAGMDGEVRVWANEEGFGGAPIELSSPDGLELISVAFSGDGQRLAASGGGRVAYVWDLSDPETFASPAAYGFAEGDLITSALSPDGSLLAGAGSAGLVYLWETDPAGSEAPEVLIGHSSTVNSLHFSQDGERLVSTSNDATARVWEVAAGALSRAVVIKPRPTDTPVFAGATSEDGTTIATGGEDLQVRDCGACTTEIDRALELTSLPDLGPLDDADRTRAISG